MNDHEHIHWISVMWICGFIFLFFILSFYIGTLSDKVKEQDKKIEALIKYTNMPIPIVTEIREIK